MEVVSADLLRTTIGPLDLVDAMRDAFVAISDGRVHTTFSLLDLEAGDVQIKAGSRVGGPLYAIKVASWVPSNAYRGLPSGSGAILACSAATGAPVALLVDEHHITDARTAAAGALATDLLAATGASTVAVLGAGTQARLQVATLAALRPLDRVVIWARRRPAAEALVGDLTSAHPRLRMTAVSTAREAVESADIVITTTAGRQPIIDARWLRPGQHVTALGADDDRKRELATGCFSRADRVVVDSRAQTCATAELAEALSERALREEEVAELGDVIAGRAPGRTSEEQITIAKLTGVAAQDLAAAEIALDRLRLLA